MENGILSGADLRLHQRAGRAGQGRRRRSGGIALRGAAEGGALRSVLRVNAVEGIPQHMARYRS